MKLPVIVLSLISLSTVLLAQPGTAQPVLTSDAQDSFARMKTLAGTWQGTVRASSAESPANTLPNKAEPSPVAVTLRVTSSGNALVHEMWNPQKPDDARNEHAVTVFYLEGDRLMLTHYCDLGNRPLMAARSLNAGKTLEFDLVGIAGALKEGYMNHVVFTQDDANRHTEEWTALLGGKPMRFNLDLQRKQGATGTSRR